jgi:anthranilate synthase component 1
MITMPPSVRQSSGALRRAPVTDKLAAMNYQPDFQTFRRLADSYQHVPVYRRLTSDTLTPVLGFYRLCGDASACLFESVIGGEKVGRYSFLTTDPYFQLTVRDKTITSHTAEGSHSRATEHPLAELREHLRAASVAHPPGLPPFIGGAVGYASYDLVRYGEYLPHPPADDLGLPDLSFAFYDRMVVFDNIHKTVVVLALGRREDHLQSVREMYDQAAERVDELVERMTRPDLVLPLAEIDTGTAPPAGVVSNFPRHEFQLAVDKCVEYIRAGDIFQVVLSQRFSLPLRCPPFEIYRTLRTVNPSPFMFYVRMPEVTLVGSSPEIMCRVVGDQVTVRPLAGTRRRGRTAEEDEALAQELLADPKERAEHAMLVDLGRNDVGRVARYGTVELSDVMTLERYSHVMHITSNVTARLAQGCDAFDALQACLPAGTVSGAPKVRAMEIIDELEKNRRGPYGGAVGYFDFSGNMDTCIALRTILIKNDMAYVQAGAGIVADSVPENEYQETWNKARGLLTAIGQTERRLGAQR